MTDHNCDDILGDIDRYLDRDLDAGVRAEIETHLKECSPCLEAFDFESELRRVIAKGCREQAPDGLRSRILAALERCEGESGPDVR